jgi:hypothetical protein
MSLTILSPNIVANSTLSVDVASLPFLVQTANGTNNVVVQAYSQVFPLDLEVPGSVTSTTSFLVNEAVVQHSTGATAVIDGTILNASTAMYLKTITGAPTATDYWTGVTSKAVFTPTGATTLLWAGNLPVQQITTPSQVLVLSTGTADSSIQFYLVFYNDINLAVRISPPSGFRCYKQQQSCVLEWVTPPYNNLLGVRIQISTDPTGITVPYAQVGDLVNSVTRSANVQTSSLESAMVNTPGLITGNYTLSYTVTENFTTTTFDSVSIAQSYVNADIFYAVASTILQDPTSNQIYESQQVGPITCGFVNLKAVNPTDFLALQRKEDVAQRMISQIIRIYPDLDLTPRSENRDLFIDPFAVEISNMSVRQWYALCCQSISALAQIDNANGNGYSDPVSDSSVKQQLAAAFGLNSTDIQSYIDHAFDVAGEDAGLTRGGPTYSAGTVTFFTYVRPTTLISIQQGAVVATLADSSTASVNFTTQGSASIDPRYADSLYNATKGWWSVDISVVCQTAGSVGTIGAGAIRQTVSGVPQGMSCINQSGTSPAVDTELNSRFAERIKNKKIVGVDTGTRYGYWGTAIQTPGIVQAMVVAAGDDEMLRDWLPADISDSGLIIKRSGKHIFGCVDIYTRGTSFSEQINNVVYNYSETGSLTLNLLSNSSSIKFSVNSLTSPLYMVLSLSATSLGRMVYLGVQTAQVYNNPAGLTASIFVNPAELTYTLVNGVQVPGTQTNGAFITGVMASGNANYILTGRYHEDIFYNPPSQPLLSINSVTGPQTGVIDPSNIELIHTQDFLLAGGSNAAGDAVQVDSTQSAVQQVTLVYVSPITSLLIDSNMVMMIDPSTGAISPPKGFTVVNAYDPVGPPYVFGVDYTITSAGPYEQYNLQLVGLNILNQSGIPLNGSPSVVVTYYKFILTEKVNFYTDTITLTGTVPSYLTQSGFIYNTWLPNSYGLTTLTSDVSLINATPPVPLTSRYIKVVWNSGTTSVPIWTVLQENRDFILTVDHTSGQTSITAKSGGSSTMPFLTGGTTYPLFISYYASEVFAVSTQIPTWVDQLAATLATSKHADADVLVKAMVASPVDITMTVTISPTATQDTVDNLVRSAIGIVLNNSQTDLDQSLLVQQVRSQPGVTGVQIPITKCAKSDGAYDIGFLIPSNTPWVSMGNRVYVAYAILQNSTLNSGGTANAYVGFLYESESYTRTFSLTEFQGRIDQSFFISAAGDVWIRIPTYQNSANSNSYRVTYQVWNEEGAKDITTSSTEYLSPGNITIDYIVGS